MKDYEKDTLRNVVIVGLISIILGFAAGYFHCKSQQKQCLEIKK